MRESDFLNQLLELLSADVVGMSKKEKLETVRAICDQTEQVEGSVLPVCRFIPFMTGRRPIDEAAHPGLGSSDNTSMILDANGKTQNHTYLLYQLEGFDGYNEDSLKSLGLDITISFAGTDGSQATYPVPGWDKRPIKPMRFEKRKEGNAHVVEISMSEALGKNLVFEFSPDTNFLPGSEWQWEDLDSQIRAAATDVSDPFTFGHMFTQKLNVSLRVTHAGNPIAASQTWIDICDTRRFGSLYQRIVDRLVKPDTARQASAAGITNLDHTFHPWFPVLFIGSDKAALYTDALIEDIVHKKRHLTDPQWLMRVGLYLELLTCIGIFEAVKADVGDLLTPEERKLYENHNFFKEIRRRLNPMGWKRVWALREIALPRFGIPQTGPVSITNLLQKRKATLAFLKVHHEDLKHAIELAGVNHYNAQETWHRVFRDAERAVLRKTPGAFPELSHLDGNIQEFVLWHEQGKMSGLNLVSKQVTGLFGDQDGLFASACHQYRASMNEVAEWGKHRGLMDYTGEECVPVQVSLLRAYMDGNENQLIRLQRRDGYKGHLHIEAKLPDEDHKSEEQVLDLISRVPIFKMLSDDEKIYLAHSVREIQLGPFERIIIQGRPGTSMFLISEGELEVLVRQADGVDHVVGKKNPGDVVGEISLLTGEPRSATVRAIDGAVVYEIGKRQYEPIIKARPELIDQLTEIMYHHIDSTQEQIEYYYSKEETLAVREKIRRFFFGG